ncbi:zinc ribbon domain-containing protein [Pullulanibacillus sp. KACC 23026]|uniref:zinc ribbon domain-containing protein n=1 Tax=Pullulanibacillus sp. KACC 23026 TaxID=3028315 RepID=UPI0023AF77F2|nr:zinc ribbon domain-containing protein [Pullulanibacillus sp. KACC 23026]WEG12004.1 zinc ribbon domain-containing protein [Pullulanibacillus sp. KACC 23026]
MADDKDEKILCYRCGYSADKGDKHCVLCGAPLENLCMDEPGLVHSGCGAKNDPHAAFCKKCGHPTLFHHHGIVTPHPSASGIKTFPFGGFSQPNGGPQAPLNQG